LLKPRQTFRITLYFPVPQDTDYSWRYNKIHRLWWFCWLRPAPTESICELRATKATGNCARYGYRKELRWSEEKFAMHMGFKSFGFTSIERKSMRGVQFLQRFCGRCTRDGYRKERRWSEETFAMHMGFNSFGFTSIERKSMRGVQFLQRFCGRCTRDGYQKERR